MINERYEQYERHMLVLARIWRWIRKYYKVAILPPVCAVTALLAFLAMIGTFTVDLTVSDCYYGEDPSPHAEALLSEVTYEYASAEDKALWGRALPPDAGDYLVRAVSKNGFGKSRYSEPVAFCVLPVELRLNYREMHCLYGDEEKYVEEGIVPVGLVGEDRLCDLECRYERSENGQVIVTVTSFHVFHENGKDATASYTYVPQSGMWWLEKRPITVASGDFKKEYDGTSLCGGGEKITQGTLAYGDTLVVTQRDTLTDVGSVKNGFEISILNGEEEEVVGFYAVTYAYGQLTVTPRAITVATADGEKEYDGQPLTAPTCLLKSGSLVEGHQLTVVSSATLTDAGEIKNEAEIRVVDEDGVDVTGNYAITLRAGTLKVTPRPITVTSGSASRVFDGTPLRDHTFLVSEGRLVTGHQVSAVFTGSAMYVGNTNNTFQCTIKDRDGRDVTLNYEIKYEYGILTIEPIVLKFKTDGAQKVYDATPLTDSGWRQISGELFKGHTLRQVFTTGSQTNAGESKNTLSVKILDEKRQDVTAKVYEIEVDYGILKVTPRKVVFTSGSAEKPYDGTPLTKHSVSYSGAGKGSSTGLIAGHYPYPTFTGSQTKVGSSPNTMSKVSVRDSSSQKDVTANYDIELKFGKLTVTPSGHPIETEEDEAPEKSGTEIGGPMDTGDNDTHYATFRYYGVSEPTRIFLRETSYGDYTGSGWTAPPSYSVQSLTANPLFFLGDKTTARYGWNLFQMTYRSPTCPDIVPYGMLSSYASKSSIKGGDDVSLSLASRTYDTRAVKPVPYSTLSTLSTSGVSLGNRETAYRSFVYKNYLDVPASTKQALLKIAKENGIEANRSTLVTDIQNYISHAAVYKLDIAEFPAGVDKVIHFLTVTKEGYCQHFASAATLMYRSFGIPARYTVGFAPDVYGNELVKVTGEMAHAWVEIYLDGVGWVPLEVTAAASGGGGGGGGGGVTADGRQLLTISTYSAEKCYDGHAFEEWTGKKYWISSGSLLEGHRLQATVEESAKGSTYPGKNPNILADWKIVDASGRDVSSQYHVEKDIGYRTIVKRPITIMSASATKVYDGTALSDPRYWIAEGGLAEGHRLTVTVTGRQTNVGSLQNKFTYSIVDEKSGSSVRHLYEVSEVYGTLRVLKE